MVKHVTILDDSKGEDCAARCGTDWSSVEAVTLARQRIKDRFGDGVKLEYVDLSKPMTDSHALGLAREIERESLSLPLLVVDGVPRISGQFDIRQLLDVIETELEVSSEQRM